jgi:hypothetical protein
VKELFVLIANPTQMMNAIEARHFYKNEFSRFHLVVFSDAIAYIDQILALADDQWNKIIYRPGKPGKVNSVWNAFKKRNFIHSVLRNAKQGDAIMIGNIHHFGCCAIAHLWNDEGNVYALDDGLGTVNWDMQLRDAKVWCPKPARGWKGKLEKWLLGNPIIELDKLKFFSVYPLSHFTNCDENNFISLRNDFSGKKIEENLVLFLDQPLVELGIVSLHDYQAMMGKIYAHYKLMGLEFKIVRHRAAHFRNAINGVEYLEFDQPIEWEMKDWKSLPGKVSTFYSSGVYHLSKMSQGAICADFWQIQSEDGDIRVQPKLMNWLGQHSLAKMNVLNVSIGW